jgi:hypothetical protein
LTISISKEDLDLDYESKIINTVIRHGGKIERSMLLSEITTFSGNFDSIVDACDDLIRISSVIYHKDSFELYIPLYNGISEFLNSPTS